MASKDRVSTIFDKAYELQEQYTNVLEARAANRRSLRDLATQDLLSEEEVAAVEELYPRRASSDTETVEAAV